MISVAPFLDFPEPVSIVVLFGHELLHLSRLHQNRNLCFRVLAVEQFHSFATSSVPASPFVGFVLAVLPDSVRTYLADLRSKAKSPVQPSASQQPQPISTSSDTDSTTPHRQPSPDQAQAVSRADSTDFDRGFTNHHRTLSVTPPPTPSPKSTT